jgi:hypothetical protein
MALLIGGQDRRGSDERVPAGHNFARSAAIVAVVSVAVYYLSARVFGGTGGNEFAYFDRLAHAFVNGRLDVDVGSGPNLDLVQADGKWYVPFPPLPAILLLPWALLSGSQIVNAVLFSVVLGTANVVATFGMLEALTKHGLSQLRQQDNLWLTLLFSLGTVHWYMTLQGSVWFLAQLATYGFVVLAIWAAVSTQSGLLAGAAMGAAMLGRPHVALLVPLLVAVAWTKTRTQPDAYRRLVRWLVLCALPTMGAVAGLLVYNKLRFGSLFEFGYTNAAVSPELSGRLERWGQFDRHYLKQNLRSLLWAPPQRDPATGDWQPDLDGMALLFTTPAFLYLAVFVRRTFNLVGAATWLSIGLVLVPLLLYYNTGWWQFGYRFSLDFTAPLLVLMALAGATRLTRSMQALIVLSIAINAWGTTWFMDQIGRGFAL